MFPPRAFQHINANFHVEYLAALRRSQNPFPSPSAEAGSRPRLVAWAGAAGEDHRMPVEGQGTPLAALGAEG